MAQPTLHTPAESHTGHTGHHEEHHGSLRIFLMVFGGLCILTFCSFASAQIFADTPVVSWIIMMAISCMKALLVISFFMHLLWEANWKYVLTIPASIMSILIVLLLIPDIGRRTRMYSEERWRHAAIPQEEPDILHGAPEDQLVSPGKEGEAAKH
jgi:cytochrome c oxidase subunit IV